MLEISNFFGTMWEQRKKTAGPGWQAVFPFVEKLVEIKLRGNREFLL
ncbi:hypothetical protein CHCC20375_2158 [Bacillus licheniformis]|nr:hypothetical protein CHCC20375_2158 [Bacillus licheniformis]